MLFFSSIAFAQTAQTQTTSNLITSSPSAWSGIGGYSQLNGALPGSLWGCCTSYSGAAPFLDTSTGGLNGDSGQIHWSYGQATVRQIIAINQALANVGAGVQIAGYNWGYEIRNNNGTGNNQAGTDSITATTFLTNSGGTRILTDTRTYSTKQDWTAYGGTVVAGTAIELANAGHLGIEFTSMDSGYWAGYYGPQVRNVSLSLNYRADPCVVDPQSSPSCPGFKTYYTNMVDDGYVRVNLPFAFPYYGQTFTTSYMFTNGVVGFLEPTNSFCCSGVNMNWLPGPHWNFAIYGLQTDLIPGPDSKFWTQVGDNNTSMRYGWDDVYQYGTQNKNTFNIQIKSSGYIGIQHTSLNVNSDVTVGIAGDINQGQFKQIYHGSGTSFVPNSLYSFTGTETTDICTINPLSSASCPGYQEAYFNQQCSINPLYNTQCPGYQQAYFSLQCSANPLYNSACPGYEQAYLNQQCSINPLSNSACSGYQTALEACSGNPLGNNLCPNYTSVSQSCSANPLTYTYCPNYSTTLSGCATNPLSNNLCPGYSTAFQACSANQLTYTYCPSYSTALSSCASNPQSNVLCPGYNATATTTTTTAAPVPSATTAAASVSDNPASVAISDPVISTAVSTPSSTSATSATSQTSVVAPKPAPVVTSAVTQESQPAQSSSTTQQASAKAEEKKEEQKKADGAVASVERKSGGNAQAAKAAATERAKELANDISKATTLEQQTAQQSAVVGLIGFVPGFSAYQNAVVPDVLSATVARRYGQPPVDNRTAQRRLQAANESKWNEIVESQYNNKGK